MELVTFLVILFVAVLFGFLVRLYCNRADKQKPGRPAIPRISAC